jgi:hypothetical protein
MDKLVIFCYIIDIVHSLFALLKPRMFAADFVLEATLLESLFNGFPVHNVPNSFEILRLAVLVLEAMGKLTRPFGQADRI